MKKVIKWVAVAFIFIGFMYVLGTVGDSDVGSIGCKELVERGLCGLGLMGAGVLTAYTIEQKENG